jgi:hypothetical protein
MAIMTFSMVIVIIVVIVTVLIEQRTHLEGVLDHTQTFLSAVVRSDELWLEEEFISVIKHFWLGNVYLPFLRLIGCVVNFIFVLFMGMLITHSCFGNEVVDGAQNKQTDDHNQLNDVKWPDLSIVVTRFLDVTVQINAM